MPSRARLLHVLLCALLGAGLYAAIGLACAALVLAVLGSGPHGYGDLILVAAPMTSTPAGLVLGLIFGVFTAPAAYRRPLLGLLLLSLPMPALALLAILPSGSG